MYIPVILKRERERGKKRWMVSLGSSRLSNQSNIEKVRLQSFCLARFSSDVRFEMSEFWWIFLQRHVLLSFYFSIPHVNHIRKDFLVLIFFSQSIISRSEMMLSRFKFRRWFTWSRQGLFMNLFIDSIVKDIHLSIDFFFFSKASAVSRRGARAGWLRGKCLQQ